VGDAGRPAQARASLIHESIGKRTVTVVPRPDAVRISNFAPRFLARARILAKPKPVPSLLPERDCNENYSAITAGYLSARPTFSKPRLIPTLRWYPIADWVQNGALRRDQSRTNRLLAPRGPRHLCFWLSLPLPRPIVAWKCRQNLGPAAYGRAHSSRSFQLRNLLPELTETDSWAGANRLTEGFAATAVSLAVLLQTGYFGPRGDDPPKGLPSFPAETTHLWTTENFTDQKRVVWKSLRSHLILSSRGWPFAFPGLLLQPWQLYDYLGVNHYRKGDQH